MRAFVLSAFICVHRRPFCFKLATASGTDLGNLDRYAKCVGLAFQVVDDILDCESNTEKLGKTAGKDQDANKPTYVSLMGLNQAKQFANDLLAANKITLPFIPS